MMSLDQRDQPAFCQFLMDGMQFKAPTLEVPDQGQRQGHAVAVELLLNRLPCCHQNNGLGGISSRSLENSIEILSGENLTSGVVGIVLSSNFKSNSSKDIL